jgi:predicted membrane channel-forming protein YqfA (hemolysin III family)
MRLNHLLSFIGFIILAAGTYCPILHPIIGSWDVYDGNKAYGIVILLVALVGILGTVFNQKIIPVCAWLSVALVVVFYILAILKVHTSFDFIPLHFVARYLTSKLKFKWGWYLLFGGPLLALAGTFLQRKPIFNNANVVADQTKY